jgi:hypothetical protein
LKFHLLKSLLLHILLGVEASPRAIGSEGSLWREVRGDDLRPDLGEPLTSDFEPFLEDESGVTSVLDPDLREDLGVTSSFLSRGEVGGGSEETTVVAPVPQKSKSMQN